MRFPLTSSISFLALALSFVQARPQPFGSSQDLEDSQFEKRASNWAHFGDKTYNNGKIVRGVNLGSWVSRSKTIFFFDSFEIFLTDRKLLFLSLSLPRTVRPRKLDGTIFLPCR